MKKYLFSSAIITLLSINFICAQTWQWAKSSGGKYQDFNSIICTDQLENLYVAGFMLFPTSYFQKDSFSINGFNDFFIAKYDNNGNEIWVKQFGGPNNDFTYIKTEGITDLVFDPVSNSIYVTGIFYQSCNFGITTLNSSQNGLQIFIAKFDLQGNCLWAKKACGSGEGVRLTTDLMGNVYLEGSVSGGFLDTHIVKSGGILAKINSDGNTLWVKNIYTKQYGISSTYGVVDLQYFNNKLFMFGFSQDSLTIGNIKFSNRNYYSQILSSWDTNGNVKWAKQFSGPSNNYYGQMSHDNFGNIYFTGSYSGSYATFGSDTIFSSNNNQAYIAKYDQNGTKIWIKQINVTNNVKLSGVNSDDNGDVYFTGSISGNASFGKFKITANTSEDILLVRYNSFGDCLGIRHFGEGFGFDVLSDFNGGVFVCGAFKNTVNFGLKNLKSYGYTDAFIAKHDAITGNFIEPKRDDNKLVIYANPNTGKCNINIPYEFINESKLTLYIFDNSGKIIQQQSIEIISDKININIEQVTTGVYNVILSNGKKNYNGKIIIE